VETTVLLLATVETTVLLLVTVETTVLRGGHLFDYMHSPVDQMQLYLAKTAEFVDHWAKGHVDFTRHGRHLRQPLLGLPKGHTAHAMPVLDQLQTHMAPAIAHQFWGFSQFDPHGAKQRPRVAHPKRGQQFDLS